MVWMDQVRAGWSSRWVRRMNRVILYIVTAASSIVRMKWVVSRRWATKFAKDRIRRIRMMPWRRISVAPVRMQTLLLSTSSSSGDTSGAGAQHVGDGVVFSNNSQDDVKLCLIPWTWLYTEWSRDPFFSYSGRTTCLADLSLIRHLTPWPKRAQAVTVATVFD